MKFEYLRENDYRISQLYSDLNRGSCICICVNKHVQEPLYMFINIIVHYNIAYTCVYRYGEGWERSSNIKTLRLREKEIKDK